MQSWGGAVDASGDSVQNPSMSAFMDKIRSLMGKSAYEPTRPLSPMVLDSKSTESMRRAIGGGLQPIPNTQLRWYLADLEYAQAEADAGNLAMAGQLYRSMRRDGVFSGLLATRTGGLVRQPKRFYGSNEKITESLRAKNGSRCVFDEMCPPGELEALDADGVLMNVGLGELVPVAGRKYPVLRRLDPEWLNFNWADSTWYYNSRVGRFPVTPGDGRWVLHIPKGSMAPWQWGLIWAMGRAFIMKEHAVSLRGAFISGVANPLKVLQSPSGATEAQRGTMVQHLLNWGPNAAVECPPGWELKLLEFMGRAHEVFQREIDTNDKNYMIGLAGQIISTEGGSGFQNADLPATIRTDLIKTDGEALAYTVSTQILPYYAYTNFGEAAVEAGTSIEWDTNSPADQMVAANVLMTLGNAIEKLQTVLPGADIHELTQRFGLPISNKIETDKRFLPIEEEEEEGDEGAPGSEKSAKNGAQQMKKPKKAA